MEPGTAGGVISCVMLMFSWSVQPLAAVTVTVYVPGDMMSLLEPDPNPLFQL